MFKKTLFVAGASYFFLHKKAYCSPQPPLSMILRGAYENKIRRYSPPQKIFDVFATIYEKGRLLMSMTDLCKAICFYNFSVSDQSHIENFKPKHIISFLGKDDRFQIYDYFILARFLAYQRARVQAYFKRKNIIEMTQSQFSKFLIEQVCADYVDHIKQSILIQSRQFKPSKQDFEKKILQVSKSMFDKRQAMTFKQVQNYRKRLVEELYEFQFLMFPIQNNKIDGVDFARSIVKYVQPSKTQKYMKRIKRMNELENVKIDLKGYKAFHLYMWANIQELQNILNERGAISTSQLTQLIDKFVNKGSVTSQQIEVAVKILDYDDSGFLQKKQVLGVLKNLQYYTSVKSGQQTLLQSLKQDYQKFVNKFYRIKQILEE